MPPTVPPRPGATESTASAGRLKRIDLRAVSLAGIAAGAAYAAVLEVDLRLTGRNVDDLTFLGRPFARDPARARAVGAAIHLSNSLALATAYALLGHDRLPGPPWLRGTIFANVENIVLYPLTGLEDLHPAIREGQLARYWTWPSFLQSVPRHVAYGAVLGALYDRLRRSAAP